FRLRLLLSFSDDSMDRIPTETELFISEERIILNRKKKLGSSGSRDFNADFDFGERDVNHDDDWVMADVIKQLKKKRTVTTLDQKIEKIRKKRKVEVRPERRKNGEEEEGPRGGEDEELMISQGVVVGYRGNSCVCFQAAESFYEDASQYDDQLTFDDMNLSRPILKAVTALGFKQPTPIQKACVPVGLLGRDLCACAATGTGKTAAFMLPVLERLVYKPRMSQVTRVLVLVPTRELGIQVHSVAVICLGLSPGGLDLKSQEAALRAGADVLIATPCFELTHIEILILDEADRMLDEYFEEQMKEIIRLCSYNRQTMLFSATMTEEVKDLAAVSLKQPIRIFVNSNTDVAPFLRQEFVRIRPNREGDREAVVAGTTTHDTAVLLTDSILLGLMGLKVGELHGELSVFKDEQIDILVATDVAARGLDIDGVKTVINFTMPSTVKHYVHRVGRTARAGRSGRSVSLVGESERKMLKEVVKSAKNSVKARVLPPEVILKFRDLISKLEKDVEAVTKLEREERELAASEAKSEECTQFEILKAQMFAERAAKRERRPKRARVMPEDETPTKAANQKMGKGGKKSVFDKELTNTSSKALKHYRAGPSFADRKRLGLDRKHPGSSR
uniref:RNA helicase n=1 Tax=Lates calcarifer TaxID=8187 RepID=A0A4W6DFE1_LATCA